MNVIYILTKHKYYFVINTCKPYIVNLGWDRAGGWGGQLMNLLTTPIMSRRNCLNIFKNILTSNYLLLLMTIASITVIATDSLQNYVNNSYPYSIHFVKISHHYNFEVQAHSLELEDKKILIAITHVYGLIWSELSSAVVTHVIVVFVKQYSRTQQ